MPETKGNLRLVYPAEGQSDYYGIMVNLFERLDILFGAVARNSAGIFGNSPTGESWEYVSSSGILTTKQLMVVRPYDGDSQVFAGVNIALTANQTLYIDWTSLTLKAAVVVPPDNTTAVLTRIETPGGTVIAVNPLLNISIIVS
jgi:hypothetical protein